MNEFIPLAQKLSAAQRDMALSLDDYQLGCWFLDYHMISWARNYGKTALGGRLRVHFHSMEEDATNG